MDLGQMGVTPEMIQSIAQQLGLDPDALMQQAQQNPEVVQQIAQMVANSTAGGEGAANTEGAVPEAAEEEAEATTPPPAEEEAAEGEAAPQQPQSAAPTATADEGEDGGDLPQNAQLAAGRTPPMPPRGMPPGGGGQMDELISAAMMQQAGGNPNMPVPNASMGRMPRPAMPSSSAGAASTDPAAKGMIANIYRQIAAQNSAADKTGVPRGPRGPATAASPARGRRKSA